jgi:hypothetical protein
MSKPKAISVKPPQAALPATTYFSQYEVGSAGDNGHPIIAIISRTDSYVIYKTDDGKIGFDATPAFLKDKKDLIEKYDDLSIQATYSLPPKHRNFVYDRLGFALANSFVLDDKRSEKPFSVVEKCIEDISDDYFQFYYVIASGSILLIFLLSFISAYYFDAKMVNEFTRSAFMGALGAFLSVLTRSRKLKSNGFVSLRYSVMQGILRTIIGGSFGALSFILMKANFVLGTFGDNMYHVLLVAVFAGFNERYVPEAMKYTKE